MESHIQTDLFRFYDVVSAQVPELVWAFHVPNGGHRHVAVARQLKAQGVKRGVPDVLLPIASRQWIGLAIELKHGKNKETPEQLVWLHHLQTQNWCCVVSRNWTHAAAVTLSYLGHDPARFGLTDTVVL
jgi:hypothetical protein